MSSADLPLSDYDDLTLGAVESRIRSLDAASLRQLLDYERAHGNRLPVVQLLEQRSAQLEAGAEPTGGSPDALDPAVETTGAPESVSPARTEGPPVNPPSHGDPTNPAQPRG
jgi:hypothetical protein